MENCECKNIIEKILGTTTNDIMNGSGWWKSTESPGCTWFPADNKKGGGMFQLLLKYDENDEKVNPTCEYEVSQKQTEASRRRICACK